MKRKGRFFPKKQEIERQRLENLQGPLVSIVTPLFNTPEGF
jgi:hypothetical protein